MISIKKKYITFISVISLFLYIFFTTPIFYRLRSYIVMAPYSYIHVLDSIGNKKGIDISIPGGASTKHTDWFPFVMTFNDDSGFSLYTGKDLSLSILYNFGAFEAGSKASSFYNPESPYFSSFYGAYIVYNNQNLSVPYGFNNDGSINVNEVLAIPQYDQLHLVLPSLGCPRENRVFTVKIDTIVQNVNYINTSNWTKAEATIKTNSPIHHFSKNNMGYIQFGNPPAKYYKGEDFPVVELQGRIYTKFVDKYNATIILYILAPNMDTIERCDTEILSKTKLK